MALLNYANGPDSIILEVRWGGWGYAPFLNERVPSVRDDGYSDKASPEGVTLAERPISSPVSHR